MSKKIFKRIYIEITNKCNLKCSFCSKLEREFKDMSIDEFGQVISEISEYTDYIYLHVKGEPLIHKDFSKILDIANQNKIFVNITTNGVLIDKVKDVLFSENSIRQINISLHALETISEKEKYLDNIVDLIKKVNETKTFYLSLRLWIDNEKLNNYIKDFFKRKLGSDLYLGENVFWSFDEEFEWPSLTEEKISEKGKCLGTKSHIAILSNGDVVPCCLDGNGIIKLGNIFEDGLNTILNSKRFNDIRQGFNNNILVEELCQKCKYRRK